MNIATLIELAEKWERDAVTPQVEDGSPGAEIMNAKARGGREQLKACANDLRMLVQVLG